MKTRLFGRTGHEISAIGFGGMRFEDIGDKERCAELVVAAYEAGINYFDTAPGYFGGRSEERFGLAFQQMRRTRKERPFFVSTKTNKAEPDEIRRHLELSLERMGVDFVDFYHVWWIVQPAWYYDRKARGALDTFSALKEEGLIRHVMLSSHMSGQESEEVLRDYPFDGILLGYSALNARYRHRALEVAAEQQRGVVVMNPLSGGVIAQHADRFSMLRSRDDETVVQGALRFLLDIPQINVVLVGLSNRKQLDEALAAEAGYQPLGEKKRARMTADLERSLTTLCTGCGYCDSCEEGLSVPRLMQSANEAIFDPAPKATLDRMQYGYGIYPEGHKLDACTECGKCEQVCTQKLPIIERLRKLKRLVADANK
jgi:predicted aldo/keto reductase-like oxidoreductase